MWGPQSDEISSFRQLHRGRPGEGELRSWKWTRKHASSGKGGRNSILADGNLVIFEEGLALV